MARAILPKWIRPNKIYLEETFPSGKPSFDPFPTVTELTYAYHCPLAIYHYLHHSEDGAFTPWGTAGGWRAGDAFHRFIERLKIMIIEGKIVFGAQESPSSKLRRIWSEFMSFGKALENPNIIWEQYLKPWTDRKIDELDLVDTHARIYFEITAASNYVQFATEEGGTRTYPLIGRIDEIDLNRKRIVERTIKSDASPKDYQLWLLWKILCSIDRAKYPEGWEDVDFNEFELVVETPHKDFPVKKTNPAFERCTNECYAWVHDLTFDPKAVWDAYKERACTYENRKADCGLSWMCYARKQPFPTSRNEMRRIFKDVYRALLWEKMWTLDFFQYKFVTFTERELEERGLVTKGRTIPGTRRRNTFQVEIPSSQVGLIWAKGSDDVGRFLVVFGNLSIGQRLEAVLEKRDQNIFSVSTAADWGYPFHSEPIIATVGADFLVFEERPTHLIRGVQRDIHRLEFHGVKDQKRAEQDSKIQLMECVFGRKNIKRGGS